MKYLVNFDRYKGLLWEFVLRDLKIKYRKSVLGYFWSLLNPLLMMIVLTAVFSNFFRFDIPNFPVYLLTGQILFSFFSEATSTSMNSIINSGSLIKKVYIPKYIFPISRVISSFISLLFSLLAIIIVIVITKVKISAMILFFPIPLLYVFLFSLGIGFILSVLAVFFRDMLHLYTVILSAWMYLTPIFYPISILPDYVKTIIHANPMYYFVKAFRDITLYNQFPDVQTNVMCMLFSLGSFVIGLAVFYKYQHKFVLYV
ncbi:ABC transporter permease [Paenibacillus polysaccharolyticus]|uniref:ABC transporter permease n=1 Tax=Paenibacillus polysaccharolyticus TaxID=582692 RepID=UPI0020A1F657|nr:ABC transporter permease [Paenibacillus polysaccharolyticus]MCP1137540.1 ABC transporter permease [Paenibacillus polysaccharolyticus]